MSEPTIIAPQEGYQMMALSSSADIIIGGGAAGAGKTFSLLMDPMRYFGVPEFNGVIFRRTTPQITAAGGLWDESKKLYPHVNGVPNETNLHWTFKTEKGKQSRLKFSHLEHEKNVVAWQGSQIPFIGFDELTHFSKETFFFLLSRNRSTCGVKPCVRATCNPDPDSWVYELIEWWIGQDGYPIPERQGVVRYFVKDGDTLIWGDTIEDCLEKAAYFVNPLAARAEMSPENFVKSITFIGGSVYENKKLLDINPEYLANLAAQSEDTRKQLLGGNWKVSLNPDDIYDYENFRNAFHNIFVDPGKRSMTIDVALEGKDKLILSYFNGFRWEDVVIIPKSSGKEIIDAIKAFQIKHRIPNSRIVYDADGVGGFIGGKTDNSFFPGSRAFHNGGKQILTNDKRNFSNLKTQCFTYSGERCSRSEIFISEKVQNTMYDDKMTVRQRLLFERKAIKKKQAKDEEKLKLIPKDEMKQKYLSGSSPDLLDGLMMSEFLDIAPKTTIIKTQVSNKKLGLF